MEQPPADEPPATAEPARGFLSYSRTDLAAATELHERLRTAGLGAYQDVASNRGGDRWFTVLQEALASSQWFLVLVWHDASASRR